MLKFILSITIFVIFFGISTTFSFAKKEEPVVSTQGIENIEQNLDKTISDKEQKKDWKEKNKEKIKYFKTKKHIEILDSRRSKKQLEIEYLEKRLEAKKTQLDSFNSEQEEAIEKEE